MTGPAPALMRDLQRKGHVLDVWILQGSRLGFFRARASAMWLASSVFSKCWVFATGHMNLHLRAPAL